MDELVEIMARGMAVRTYIARGYVSEKDAPDAFVTAEAIADAEFVNWIDNAKAILQALTDAGRAVVPVEATEIHVRNALIACDREYDELYHMEDLQAFYKAMIAEASKG